MKQELLGFYRIQRNIFGVCPHSGEIFRLSDCKVYLRTKPKKDWKDKLDKEYRDLALSENELDEVEEEMRERARKKGRLQARRTVQLLDPIFTPRKLNPDDAKVIFHPVDYIVFDGMKNDELKKLVLLDRRVKSNDLRSLQKSIETVIGRGQYDWVTIRVSNDGTVSEED